MCISDAIYITKSLEFSNFQILSKVLTLKKKKSYLQNIQMIKTRQKQYHFLSLLYCYQVTYFSINRIYRQFLTNKRLNK